MIKLIQYELKKLFLKRTVIIAVVIFSIINLIQISNVFKQKSLLSEAGSPEWSSIYWGLYPKFSGDMTEDKIAELLTLFRPLEKKTADLTTSTANNNPDTLTGNTYMDFFLIRDLFVKPMEYMYTYQNTAAKIVQRADSNMIFYSNLNNKYEYRKNKAIIQFFEGRSVRKFAYTEVYTHYLSYDFSIFLVLLICIYGIVGVFVREKDSKMDVMLLTSILGGKKTVTAKILAVTIFVLLVSVWFSLTDFISFAVEFGTTQGGELPVFAIKNFMTSPLSVNLGQYALISVFFKAVGFWVLGMIFLLISLCVKNSLMPFIINVLLSCGFIGAWESLNYSENVFIKIINPFSLISNSYLFTKTEFLNCFGYPVLSYIVAIISGIVLGAISVLLIYKFSKQNAFVNKVGGAQ